MTNKPNELPSLPDRAQEIRALWRQLMYSHIEPETFRQYLGDLSQSGWTQVRQEVAAVECVEAALLDQLRAAQEQIRELNEAHRGSVTLMKRVVERAETAEAALQARASSGNEKEKD